MKAIRPTLTIKSYAAAIIFLCVLVSVFSDGAFSQQSAAIDVLTSKSGFAQPEASVQVVVFEGQNINCANLNASSLQAFSHITTNNELKLDFSDPNGTFPFMSGEGREVNGPQFGDKSLTISSGNATVSSWSSQVAITAINVKVGNTSYVYPYKPFASSDTNLSTGDHRGISHISFCFGDPTAATAAAGASISGRVLASNGRPIPSARLTLIKAATGETVMALTNAFGNYAIRNLEAGEFYYVQVSHKRYSFTEQSQAFTVTDDFTGVDFRANP